MIHQEHRYECEGTHEKYCLKSFVKVLSYVLPKVTADIILPADLIGAVRIRYISTPEQGSSHTDSLLLQAIMK